MTAMLTERQQKILATAARIKSNLEAAKRLGISESSLRGQLSLIRKLVAAGAAIVHTEPVEPVEPTRERIAREVAEGVRCRRCHLLLPCDHVQVAP